MKVNTEAVFEELEAPRRNGKFWAVVFVVVALVGGFYGGVKYDGWVRSGGTGGGTLNYASLDELYGVIQKNYDGEINQNDLLNGAKRGLAEGLGDPYTTYFTDEEAEAYLGDLEGEFEGIGAELDQVDGKLTIVSVIDGSPAQKAGLSGGDVIAQVNNEDSIGWSADVGAAKIRGDAGTTVKLVLIRGTETFTKALVREKITDPSVKWSIKDGNIGYLRISRFGESDTASLAKKAAEEFKQTKVKGVVLDLRNNGGGYVDAAESVAGLWLEYGEKIVEQRSATTIVSTKTSTGPAILPGVPTIILTNEYTASAAEIVTGALVDHQVAESLGTQTYGKGVVQTIKNLSHGGKLKITIAKWYTPNGVNISGDGLQPTQEVWFDSAAYQKTGADNQLQRALEKLR